VIFGGDEKDWKEFLCGNAQEELAELIEKAKQHKCAYSQADDVKVAQVWCALTEVSRQMKKIDERLTRVETGVKGLTEMANITKRKYLRERISSILEPKLKAEKDEVEKIVDSLMEF